MLKVKIDYDIIKHNHKKLQEITGYGENVIPVLKANSYNFEMEKVVKALLPQKKFFVYSVEEGIYLRKLFNDIDIYIFSSIFPQDNEYFKKYNLIPVINSLEHLKLCELKDVILQFNTGMNRGGAELSQLNEIKQYTDIHNNVLMVMSHMCCANEIQKPVNQVQINNFKKVAEIFNGKDILRSLMASDGVINFKVGDLCNSCRPGEYLYRGDKIAYDIRCDIENNTLAIGLKDGFTSEYGKNGYVLVDGEKVKIKSMTFDKIFLEETKGKEAIITNSDFYKEFDEYSDTDGLEAVPRLLAKQISVVETEGQKITATKDSFYSQIMEVRTIEENGVVGYGGLRTVSKGDKIAVFAGGYMDGLLRSITNTGCFVYVNNKPYEIYGRISMDQTTIKVDDSVKVGDKVVVYDKEHPKSQFMEKTGRTELEIFYMADKSYRVKYEN